ASLDQDSKPLPGVAQVAMQQGRFVSKVIRNRVTGRPAPAPFRYFDKGNMAVIGRGFAILDSRVVKMTGLPAWLAWAFIHILYLPPLGSLLRVAAQAMGPYFNRPRRCAVLNGAHGGA